MKTEKPKQDVGWELRKDALARFTEARAEARAAARAAAWWKEEAQYAARFAKAQAAQARYAEARLEEARAALTEGNARPGVRIPGKRTL